MPENLKRRMLGLTGLEVTQLGFGTAYNGEVGDDQAERVLNAVLDAGPTCQIKVRHLPFRVYCSLQGGEESSR